MLNYFIIYKKKLKIKTKLSKKKGVSLLLNLTNRYFLYNLSVLTLKLKGVVWINNKSD